MPNGAQREPLFRPAPRAALGASLRRNRRSRLPMYRPMQAISTRIRYRRSAELGGARTVVAVPMLKDDELIGAIAIYRQEVEPSPTSKSSWLQNFAAQAVIAIENTRLLNELRSVPTISNRWSSRPRPRRCSRSSVQLARRSGAGVPGDAGERGAASAKPSSAICCCATDDAFASVAMHDAPPRSPNCWRARSGLRPRAGQRSSASCDAKQVVHIADMYGR